jgi:hypothetical protein
MKAILEPADYFQGPTIHTSNEQKLSEKKVESKSSDVARANGWFTRKYKSPSQSGVQDRIFVKDGMVVFIEYKRIGNEPTGLQCDDASQLRLHGGRVYWTNTVRGTKLILGIYT